MKRYLILIIAVCLTNLVRSQMIDCQTYSLLNDSRIVKERNIKVISSIVADSIKVCQDRIVLDFDSFPNTTIVISPIMEKFEVESKIKCSDLTSISLTKDIWFEGSSGRFHLRNGERPRYFTMENYLGKKIKNAINESNEIGFIEKKVSFRFHVDVTNAISAIDVENATPEIEKIIHVVLNSLKENEAFLVSNSNHGTNQFYTIDISHNLNTEIWNDEILILMTKAGYNKQEIVELILDNKLRIIEQKKD